MAPTRFQCDLYGRLCATAAAVYEQALFYTCQLFLCQMCEIFVFSIPAGLPKMFRWFPNVNKEFVSSSTMRSDTVWRIQTRHIALFTGLCFLALVGVYIFFKSVSVKAVIVQIFQPGMRNWSVSMSWHEIDVFVWQVWDSRLRRKSWQVCSSCSQATAAGVILPSHACNSRGHNNFQQSLTLCQIWHDFQQSHLLCKNSSSTLNCDKLK